MSKQSRDSFIFYESFLKAGSRLTPEKQLRYYKAIFEYGLYGIEKETDKVVLMMLDLIKPQLDANKKRRENGSRGGRPRAEKPTKKEKTEEKKPMVIDNKNHSLESENHRLNDENHRLESAKANVNVNDNVNDNVNEREIKRKGEYERGNKSAPALNQKPTIEEVKKACEKLGLSTTVAEKFYYHYEANGWTQGRDKPVLNWAAQLNSWISREKEFKPKESTNKREAYKERKYSEEELAEMYDDLEKIEF